MDKNAVTTTESNPLALIEKAIQSGAGIDQLEKLMDLQERWEKSQAVKSFNKSFNQFQTNKPEIVKNKSVEFKGKEQYRFAELSAVQKAVDPVLSEYGLSYSWKQHSSENGAITIECILKHVDGHSESNSLTALPDKSGSKNDIQAIGSGVSYLKRYTLLNALGLSTGFDDDGLSTSLTQEEMKEALKDKLATLVAEYEEVLPSKMVARAGDIIANSEDLSYRKAIRWIEAEIKKQETVK